MFLNRRGIIFIFCAVLIAAIGGCATQHLPTYPWTDSATALELMANRADKVHTFAAEGQVVLTRKDGMSIVLDCALVAKPPDFLRLRAWKFNQAAMDLTLRPDGVWAWMAQQDDKAQGREEMSKTSTNDLWTLLAGNGQFFRDPRWKVQDHGGSSFTLERDAEANAPAMRVKIARDTLLVREITLLAESGKKLGTITMEDYLDGGVVPWAARITAGGDMGSVILKVREIEFNTEPPENAFTPSSRSVRLR